MDRVLNVTFQQQQTSAWCWAAVASMVSVWYAQETGGSALSQCGVAAATLRVPSCCSSSSVNPACIRLWGLDGALGAAGHFAGTGSSGGLDTVKGQIDVGQPIGALIKYWNGIFHFVLVNGYSDTQQLLVVCDPAGGQPFSIPVNVFFSNYNNGGFWGGWYFTKA